jgi:hypothetical protein
MSAAIRRAASAAPEAGACELVTVPTRQGLEAVDLLRLRAGAPDIGPVLHDSNGDSLCFLVPPGTAAGWDCPGSACVTTPAGSPSPADPGWLLPPRGGTAPVTDPAVLKAALGEAARMIALIDASAPARPQPTPPSR